MFGKTRRKLCPIRIPNEFRTIYKKQNTIVFLQTRKNFFLMVLKYHWDGLEAMTP